MEAAAGWSRRCSPSPAAPPASPPALPPWVTRQRLRQGARPQPPPRSGRGEPVWRQAPLLGAGRPQARALPLWPSVLWRRGLGLPLPVRGLASGGSGSSGHEGGRRPAKGGIWSPWDVLSSPAAATPPCPGESPSHVSPLGESGAWPREDRTPRCTPISGARAPCQVLRRGLGPTGSCQAHGQAEASGHVTNHLVGLGPRACPAPPDLRLCLQGKADASPTPPRLLLRAACRTVPQGPG